METKVIRCNCCGEEYIVEGGVVKRDFLTIEKDWGYFSQKDGQRHSIVLCENCYDAWITQFQLPPVVSDTKELL